MKHHKYKEGFEFIVDPIDFNKYTEREILQYCIGATMYMPATKDFSNEIIQNKNPGLTSMVMCFEDAIAENDLEKAEINVVNFLELINNEIKLGGLELEDIPLIFFRVRSIEQFIKFTSKLNKNHTKIIAGFVFPKFSTGNGDGYLGHLRDLNNELGDILYGMPILESKAIAFKETRLHELTGIKKLLQPYRDLVLNIRVGATDLSSCFGVRRGIDYSIYDILTVKDCLADILNFLSREGNSYVISGPVWEYFIADKNMSISNILDCTIYKSLLKRNKIINEAIDGLLREVVLDKANGFVGKTIIHPSHLKYVNAMQAVTKEEYDDALQILNTDGGVIKSSMSNKMNEINPHRYWAKKVYSRALAYGVIENEGSYIKLFT